MSRRKLVLANWKMNGNHSSNARLLAAVLLARPFPAAVSVCVPFPYIGEAAVALSGSEIHWGAQDCSIHVGPGAYTGEVSGAMLAEFGCRYVIVGHSERRTGHAESDRDVALKAKAVLACGMTPVVCLGESADERAAGDTEAVVKRQLSAVIHELGHCCGEIVVAYEPLWAVGTGLVAQPAQIEGVHRVLRSQLKAATPHAEAVYILYGGSVKPSNAAGLFSIPDVDGGLIGGASLIAEDFIAICRAAA
jgi:triosephosphate isomerase